MKDLYLIIMQKLIILKSVKSGRFHEIWQISPWNPLDFTMKSGRFQVKSTPNLIKSDVSTKNSSVLGGAWRGGYDPRFHEIQGHSPSPAFIKLNSFCWNIWFYKVFGWISPEICQISWNLPHFMWNQRPLARNCNPMFVMKRGTNTSDSVFSFEL